MYWRPCSYSVAYHMPPLTTIAPRTHQFHKEATAMTEVELVRKTCTPCRGGVRPLTPEEVGSDLPQASG